jgi:hypothetical protein
MDLLKLQDRKYQLVKGREQLMANIHATNGAIAELDHLIDLLIKSNEEEEQKCQDMEANQAMEVEKAEKVPEIKRKAEVKKAERVNEGIVG